MTPHRQRHSRYATGGKIPYILEPVESLKVERPELSSKEFRKNWARFTRLWRADLKDLPC